MTLVLTLARIAAGTERGEGEGTLPRQEKNVSSQQTASSSALLAS